MALLEAQHDVAAEEVAARALATLGPAELVRKSIGVTDYLGASIGWAVTSPPPPIIAGWRLDGHVPCYIN